MNINDLTIKADVSILEAMKVINYNGYGIALICEGTKLLAVTTDGDIRRHILRNGSLTEPISTIANYQPLFLYVDETVDYHSFLLKHRVASVPIVDAHKNVISLTSLYRPTKKQKASLNSPVVIMAGGKGTRLYPYTDILPKPLIPIGEKTITEIIMEHFESFGCNQFSMIVNYKKNLIRSFFYDHEIKRDIDFINEEIFLGTGGGLKLLEGKFSEPFFMTNCDIIIEEDYQKIMDYHNEQENLITIVTAMKNITIPYGTIQIADDGTVTGLKEKPSFPYMTNTGFYIISPEFLSLIPDQTFIHITDLIQTCIDNKQKVGVYPISEHAWMDMGQMEELLNMKNRLEM